MTRLPTDLRKTLEAGGVPWRVVNSARHLHLIVGDRLAAILPKNRKFEASPRAGRNVLATVRRLLRKDVSR